MKKQNQITVLLQGGLGNQLFGWAAAIALAEKQAAEVRVSKVLLKPNQYQLDNYQSEPVEHIWSRKFLFSREKEFKEQNYHFDPRFNALESSIILNGYFQSWKYLVGYEELIRAKFTLLKEKSDEYINCRSRMGDAPFTAIHVRRGDYMNLTSYHGLTSREYFLRASEILKNNSKLNETIVFSDDIELAREVVNWGDLYLSSRDISSPVETLDLMSRATNFIGSNSSFSWWAAFLRDTNEGIRIFPRPWFASADLNDRDLLCPNWLTLGI